jgi:transcription antitermination protein NusB
MQPPTLARELALLMLGQVQDRDHAAEAADLKLSQLDLDALLRQALTSLGQHLRESLDQSAEELQQAEQQLLESELQQDGEARLPKVRQHLRQGLSLAEHALNRLSASLELPRLLLLADQQAVHRGAIERSRAVLKDREGIDARLDQVMEGWRLTRLPRIDRDILRLAVVDLEVFGTPAAVACNEAVELANRWSDEQGRRMINGVLRRFTAARV